MPLPALANFDTDEQHHILVNSLATQPLSSGGRSEPLPAQAGDDDAKAQHAQQTAPAGKVKRKPGRARKAVPGGQTHTPGVPTSNGQNSPPLLAPAVVDDPVDGGRLESSPPHAHPSAAKRMYETKNVAVAPPAGALIPQAKKQSSVAIDIAKLLKSRNKPQVWESRASGSGKSPAEASAKGAPPSQDHVQDVVQPDQVRAVVSNTATTTVSSTEAAAEAAKVAGALSKSAGGGDAQVAQTDMNPATLSGPLSGKKKRRGRPPKQAVADMQRTEGQDQQPPGKSSAGETSAKTAEVLPATGRVPVSDEQEGAADPPSSVAHSNAGVQDLAAEPAPVIAENGAHHGVWPETDQGQEELPPWETESQSQGPDLPLRILLGEAPHKKRGRPYKNAANAEKAAERAARRTAAEVAEKAVYKAAAAAAQVVIAEPPVKKRRGRPPKDPVKLAAALAAYHASTTARQANLEAEEANDLLAVQAAQEAAEAAQAAVVEEPLLAAVSPPPPSSPKPVKKKRGRPPKAVAQAVVDNLHSPTDSIPIAALTSECALRSEGNHVMEDDDHDQAILDAAAVLTSSLPFPQDVVLRQSPPTRQRKGKRRSSNSSADAVKAAAPQERQLDRPPERQQEGQQGRPQNRSRRRQLEVVSSRATAILESIAPDSQAPLDADLAPGPSPDAPQASHAPTHPSLDSDPEPVAAPQSGYPSKRQRKKLHSSNQSATAASASHEADLTFGETQLPPSPKPQAFSGSRHDATQAQTDSSSAAAHQTATASSPHHDAPMGPVPATAEVTSPPESLPPAVAAQSDAEAPSEVDAHQAQAEAEEQDGQQARVELSHQQEPLLHHQLNSSDGGDDLALAADDSARQEWVSNTCDCHVLLLTLCINLAGH